MKILGIFSDNYLSKLKDNALLNLNEKFLGRW